MSDNLNNGLLTRIWGPALWTSLHCIAFGYPMDPSDENKKTYRAFFESIQHVLPCLYCRISYGEFIFTEDTDLTDDVFSSRENLTNWLFKLHNRVNQKLGVDYGVIYDDHKKKYESYRAKCIPGKKGCLVPLDYKQQSYLNAELKDCPIVSLKLVQCFKDYAAQRNVEFNPEVYNDIQKNSNDRSQWTQRNVECAKQIADMRRNGIPSVEQTGEFVGLPTIQELELLSKLSTTMSKGELIILAKKLGYEFSIVYKLKSLP